MTGMSKCRYYGGLLVGALRGWALHQSEEFESGCLMAANLGDDADTTAAIYGQLAGAIYGANALPAHWLVRVTSKDRIEQMALRLPLETEES